MQRVQESLWNLHIEFANVARMMNRAVSTMPQANKITQAENAFAQVMAEASRRGFYGTASVSLSVQDGRIQHIRIAVERMIR